MLLAFMVMVFGSEVWGVSGFEVEVSARLMGPLTVGGFDVFDVFDLWDCVGCCGDWYCGC
jgi:hypothetical protein